MQKELIIEGAKQYSGHITSHIPQENEEGAIRYYFSGSLAMLLLNSAKSFKPLLLDEKGKVIIEEQEILIPNKNKNSLLKGVREIGSDVDVITIDEKAFAGKGNIFHLAIIREKCDLATSLCSNWAKANGTMYFDWLTDERKFKDYNVAELTMLDGTNVFVTDPLYLTIHKFADALACKISIERLSNNGKSTAKKEEKYQKDLRDFASLFNGIVSLYSGIDFDNIVIHIIQSCPDTAFSKFMQTNLEDKIEQFSSDISTLIDEENQKLFNKFIGSIDKQNRVISEIADDEVKIEH